MRPGTCLLFGSCVALLVSAGGCSSDSSGEPTNPSAGGSGASSDASIDATAGTAGSGASGGAKDASSEEPIKETGGDGSCGVDQKSCGGVCVSVADPAYGCSATNCEPACALEHATAKCESAGCKVGTCDAGWSDCDGLVDNGCESDPKVDENNCGQCAKDCPAPDGSVPSCVNATCSTCLVGTADCDGNSTNGCEVNIKTDTNNCGVCALKCPAGGACTDGMCDPVEIASGLNSPMGIRVDDTSLFVTNSGANSVVKIPVTGGTPTELATGLSGPGPIALDSTTVYFSSGDQILSVPKAGGTVTTVATGVIATVALALDDTNVYVSNYQGAGGGIWKVAKTGGTATLLSPQILSYGIAVDAANVFFALNSDGKIMKLPKAGGAAVELATVLNTAPKGVALDATTVYWFELTDVVKVGKNGAGKKSIAQNVVGTNAIALDGSWVYFAVFTNPGSIQKARVDGSKVVKLAGGQKAPIDLTVGGESVFYITQGDGKVMIVPK